MEVRGAWHAAVHEVTKSRTRLSDWTATKTDTDSAETPHNAGQPGNRTFKAPGPLLVWRRNEKFLES